MIFTDPPHSTLDDTQIATAVLLTSSESQDISSQTVQLLTKINSTPYPPTPEYDTIILPSQIDCQSADEFPVTVRSSIPPQRKN